MKSITVDCSSSTNLDPVHYDAGKHLGRAIAARGWQLIYGGTRIGLMKELADAARNAGARVIGVTPKLMVDEGIGDDVADELLITDNMRDRKAIMEQRGDAFIALPGGLGTLEEIFEIIVGRSLGCHNKPIVLLNIAGYYDPMLAMIEHGITAHFIRPKARKLFHATADIDDALAHIDSHFRPAPAYYPSAELE